MPKPSTLKQIPGPASGVAFVKLPSSSIHSGMRFPRLLRPWLAALILWVGIGPVMAGELSPYNPPSQRQSVARPAVVDSGLSAERRQYYADFKREMSSATPDKKKSLRAEFIKQRDASVSQDEKAHYQRLVDILSAY